MPIASSSSKVLVGDATTTVTTNPSQFVYLNGHSSDCEPMGLSTQFGFLEYVFQVQVHPKGSGQPSSSTLVRTATRARRGMCASVNEVQSCPMMMIRASLSFHNEKLVGRNLAPFRFGQDASLQLKLCQMRECATTLNVNPPKVALSSLPCWEKASCFCAIPYSALQESAGFQDEVCVLLHFIPHRLACIAPRYMGWGAARVLRLCRCLGLCSPLTKVF